MTCRPDMRSGEGWLRVRDEGDKVTMSLKVVDGKHIEDQKEICLTINLFEDGIELLRNVGCIEKAYQETRRDLWMLDGVEITIDEWPFLEPYVEVEGGSESAVKKGLGKAGIRLRQGSLLLRRYHIFQEVQGQRVRG